MHDFLSRIQEIENGLEFNDAFSLKLNTVIKIMEEALKRQQTCSGCQKIIGGMSETLTMLEEAIKDRTRKKAYLKHLRKLQRHYYRRHGFVPEGRSLSIGVVVGVSIGTVLSQLTNIFALAFAAIPIGLAIQFIINGRAEKKGKLL